MIRAAIQNLWKRQFYFSHVGTFWICNCKIFMHDGVVNIFFIAKNVFHKPRQSSTAMLLLHPAMKLKLAILQFKKKNKSCITQWFLNTFKKKLGFSKFFIIYSWNKPKNFPILFFFVKKKGEKVEKNEIELHIHSLFLIRS